MIAKITSNDGRLCTFKEEDREGRARDYRVLELKEAEVSDLVKTETTGTEKSKLFPTDIGMVVNDFLVEHFKGIVDFHFTARVEKEFDEMLGDSIQSIYNASVV